MVAEEDAVGVEVGESRLIKESVGTNYPFFWSDRD